ncbi:MAG: hypothetical protein IIB89_00980 [Chloroflexi bacterium]|nr:hypothetical protein [Chloroflexota bacterium]
MIAQAQVMRAAAQEELEAQKIYAEAARFQAASQETLTQARNRLNFSRTSDLLRPASVTHETSPEPTPQPVKNNVSDPETDPAGHQSQIDRATAIAMGGLEIEPSTQTTNGENTNGSTDAISSIAELRNMQEAASRAGDAAVAEERRPANLKRTTKRKKITTNKS